MDVVEADVDVEVDNVVAEAAVDNLASWWDNVLIFLLIGVGRFEEAKAFLRCERGGGVGAWEHCPWQRWVL